MLSVLTEKFERYERRIGTISLIGGFIFDSLTLTRIDRSRDYLILGSYLLVTFVCIFIVNLYETGKLKHDFFRKAHPWLLFVMQFSFGGLFSNFVVLYSRSASVLASWPFLLILLALLIGNEFLKRHYSRLVLQVNFFFLAIFSCAIFAVPVFLSRVGDGIFVLSGLLSLAIVIGVIFLLRVLIPERIRYSRRSLFSLIFLIYAGMNILYFSNLIPPIPLSLKAGNVYHSVTRDSSGNYLVVGEPRGKYLFWKWPIVHLTENGRVYVWSSVFAPTRLSTNIVHEWSYYDNEKGKWIPSIRVEFPIYGGREEGYRGYSYREDVFPGLWRVQIKNTRGQTIGTVKFKVELVKNQPDLRTEIR